MQTVKVKRMPSEQDITWMGKRHTEMDRETLIAFVEMLNWHIGNLNRCLPPDLVLEVE